MNKKFRNILSLGAITMLTASSMLPVNALSKTCYKKVMTTKSIYIYVNGVKLKTDVEPFIYNGRVFVPVRFISEALNQKVEWNAKNWIVYIGEKTVTSSNENDINQTIVYITKTGTKYHRAGCKYLDKSAISITRGEATKKGYTPCSVCNPP